LKVDPNPDGATKDDKRTRAPAGPAPSAVTSRGRAPDSVRRQSPPPDAPQRHPSLGLLPAVRHSDIGLVQSYHFLIGEIGGFGGCDCRRGQAKLAEHASQCVLSPYDGPPATVRGRRQTHDSFVKQAL